MADVQWIRLTTDMFDNKKIKHLRRLPEGNNVVLIWVMLLTMAGRCNAGGMIFLTENIPYTSKMLADELGFEENIVCLAIQALERMGMIVADEEYFAIANWEKYQNIEGLDKIREQNRLRKQKQRAKAALPEFCHVTSRDGHATDIEEEREEEIERDKESSKKRNQRFSPPTLDEVKAYCQERNKGVDPERWYNHYTANGWMVGRNKMKDWKAAVRTCELSVKKGSVADGKHERIGEHLI